MGLNLHLECEGVPYRSPTVLHFFVVILYLVIETPPVSCNLVKLMVHGWRWLDWQHLSEKSIHKVTAVQLLLMVMLLEDQ